jgi:hypothetical protein
MNVDIHLKKLTLCFDVSYFNTLYQGSLAVNLIVQYVGM